MKTFIKIIVALLLVILGNSAKAIELQAENNSIGHWEFLVNQAKTLGFEKTKAENIVGNSAYLDPRIAGKGWGGKVWKGDKITYSIGFVKMKSGMRQVFRIDSIVRNGKLLKVSSKIREQIARIKVEPKAETVAVEPALPTEPTTPKEEVVKVDPAVVAPKTEEAQTTTEVFGLNRSFLADNATVFTDLPMPSLPGTEAVLSSKPAPTAKATPTPVVETPKTPAVEEESVTVEGKKLTVKDLQEIGDKLVEQRKKVPGFGSDLLPGLNLVQRALLTNLSEEDGQRLKEFIQNKGVQAKLGNEKTKLFAELGAEIAGKKGRLPTDDLGNKDATKPQPTPTPQASVATETPAPTSPNPAATPMPKVSTGG